MENIKRTQCALNCFSLTNNLSKYYTIIHLIYILFKNENQFGLNKYKYILLTSDKPQYILVRLIL